MTCGLHDMRPPWLVASVTCGLRDMRPPWHAASVKRGLQDGVLATEHYLHTWNDKLDKFFNNTKFTFLLIFGRSFLFSRSNSTEQEICWCYLAAKAGPALSFCWQCGIFVSPFSTLEFSKTRGEKKIRQRAQISMISVRSYFVFNVTLSCLVVGTRMDRIKSISL